MYFSLKGAAINGSQRSRIAEVPEIYSSSWPRRNFSLITAHC
jgi:hypothetical protein